jgi:hypothetical protein
MELTVWSTRTNSLWTIPWCRRKWRTRSWLCSSPVSPFFQSQWTCTFPFKHLCMARDFFPKCLSNNFQSLQHTFPEIYTKFNAHLLSDTSQNLAQNLMHAYCQIHLRILHKIWCTPTVRYISESCTKFDARLLSDTSQNLVQNLMHACCQIHLRILHKIWCTPTVRYISESHQARYTTPNKGA